MKLDLIGHLERLDVPHTKPLRPLFEAVVNAFQAIEDAGLGRNGSIEILIDRETILDVIDGPWPVQGFTVVDNGIGFTPDNLEAFFTAYTRNKLRRGGKGIGRFMFLKAFETTEIDSHFQIDGKRVSRKFSLPQVQDLPTTELEPSSASSNRTSVQLCGLKYPWRQHCEPRRELIALEIVGHCLPLFLDPNCPRVVLRDKDGETDLRAFFTANFATDAAPRQFEISGNVFTLTSFRLFHRRAEEKHKLLFCANYREVISETLTDDIPSLGEKHLRDADDKAFVYRGLVQGEYLDANTDSDRMRFTFPPRSDGALSGVICLDAIQAGAVEQVKTELATHLEERANQAEERVRRYVAKAPELRPMLRYINGYKHDIPPDISDERLNGILQKQKFRVDALLAKEGTALIEDIVKNHFGGDYETKLADYIDRSNEMGKASLARYVAHRRVILEFLERSLAKQQETGDYPLEKVIHKIVYPMNTDSTQVPYEAQNLWILDERLAFHDYLSSDKQIGAKKKGETGQTGRPDLMIFQAATAFTNDATNIQSIVVVEFKQPGRSNFGNETPIAQGNRMVRLIRAGKAETLSGMKIPKVPEAVQAFIYVVCDWSDEIEEACIDANLTRMFSGPGFYGYNKDRNTHYEVLPYKRLLDDAKNRNRSLFDKLFNAPPI